MLARPVLPVNEMYYTTSRKVPRTYHDDAPFWLWRLVWIDSRFNHFYSGSAAGGRCGERSKVDQGRNTPFLAASFTICHRFSDDAFSGGEATEAVGDHDNLSTCIEVGLEKGSDGFCRIAYFNLFNFWAPPRARNGGSNYRVSYAL